MEQNKFDPLQFIGFLLISAILMFWFYDNQSSMIENQQISEAENLVEETYADSNKTENSISNNVKIDQKFEEEIISLENENILFEISTSGAEIKKILLKNFSNYDEEPLYLVDDNKSIFSYDIPIGRNSVINSADLNYTYQIIKPGSEVILSGIIDEQRSLDLKFKLDKDSSIVDFLIKINDSNRSNSYQNVELLWGRDSFRNSRSIDYENRYTVLAYGFEGNKDSYLSIGGSTNKNINNVNWISFREHFFSSILILNDQVNDVDISSEDLASNETLDETLSYKSLNIRKSLTRFNKNDEYSDQDETWAEIFSSFQKRKEKSGILRLGNETIGVGANIINPISKDKNIIVSVETGLQKFSKDHDVNKLSISTGLHFEEIKINNSINSELYFLVGIGHNKSERQILTNTTTSGRLDITDSYLNYDFLIGNKINFNQSLPDLGFNLGYSHTPSHKESDYYKWEDKHIFNGSVSLSDEYEIVKDKQTKFYLSWIADARTVIDENVQVFYVAGAKGDYSQDHDLKEEYSLSAGINYEYAFSKDNIFLLTLDALQTSQFTSGLQANLNYNIKF